MKPEVQGDQDREPLPWMRAWKRPRPVDLERACDSHNARVSRRMIVENYLLQTCLLHVTQVTQGVQHGTPHLSSNAPLSIIAPCPVIYHAPPSIPPCPAIYHPCRCDPHRRDGGPPATLVLVRPSLSRVKSASMHGGAGWQVVVIGRHTSYTLGRACG